MKGNKDPFKGNNIYPYVKKGRTLLALTKFGPIASYAIVIFSGIVLSIMLLLPSDIPEKILNKTYAQENENNDIDLKITDGIASGDITNDSVVIWSRVNHPAQMKVEYAPISNSSHSLNQTAKANATTDYTAHAKLEGLQPDTRYKYNVSFIPLINNSNRNETRHPDFANGTFNTAPVPSKEQLVNFVVGGDLGGQRYCKRVDIGYPIFTVIKELSPDFFVSNGDMIYADNDCPVNGPQGTVGWKNIPGNFRNITDPNVNWENRTQLSDM